MIAARQLVKEFDSVFATDDVQVTHMVLAPAQEVPWHLHTEVCDIFYLVRGPVTIYTRVPDETRIGETGDTVQVPAGQAHRVVNESDHDVATPVTIHRKEGIMPLVYVTLAEGTTSQDQRAQIGDGIYRALVDVASAPEDDRFQVINEVRSANLVYSPDYMGFDRSPSVVFIQIFFNAGRSVHVKQALYARIAESLGAAGVRGDDIVINLVEVPKENWSFGRGELSYPPAPPGSTQ